MKDWLFLETHSTWAPYNLAMEEVIVNNLAVFGGHPCFLLWQNSPAVIIGRHQNARAEVNLEELKSRKINLVRRMSGGGAVYHDLGNINFSFIMPQEAQQKIDNMTIIGPLIDALTHLGVPTEMKGRNDLSVIGESGGKFSGLAYRQLVGKYQLHGTLMYDVDLSILEHVLLVDPEKYKSKGVNSVKARVTNLKPLLSCSLKQLWCAIKNAYSEKQSVIPPELEEKARELAETKYNTDKWNIGQSPEGDINLKKRFSFGSLELHLKTNKNIITEAKISGDFFTPNNTPDPIPIESLETILIGQPSHDLDALAQIWRPFDFSKVFHGSIEKEEILQLFKNK